MKDEGKNRKHGSDGPHNSHASHPAGANPPPRPIIPPRGDYRTLLSYQKAEVVYDLTFRFAHKYFARGDRTIDQMIQSARSGKQNILEGSKAALTSKETEIKLTSVGRSSLEELLADYRDYLRVREHAIWDKDSKEAQFVRRFGRKTPQTFDLYREFIETRPPAVIANIAICLIHQTNYLLDQQLRCLEQDFLKQGGLRERMFNARIEHRNRESRPQKETAHEIANPTPKHAVPKNNNSHASRRERGSAGNHQRAFMKKGWETKTLGEASEVIAGQSPERKFYNSEGKGMPFYQGKKDFGEKFIEPPTTWTTETTKVGRAGDILMSVRAPVGPVNFATREVCIGRGLAAIRSRKELNRDFLFYQLLHLQPEIAGKEGAVFASINKSEIAALPIAFAPLAEQQRILGVLDEAFAGLATAQAGAEKNLQNARALFQSHLQSVFIQRGKGWVEKSLEQIGIMQTGSTPKASDPACYGDFIPFVKPGDFNPDGSLDCENDGLSKKGLDGARKVAASSVLMVCIGATIGECGYCDRDVTTNQQINALTPSAGISHKFIYYQMLTESFQRSVMHSSAQATLPIINKSKWSALSVAIPPKMEEQKQIVSKLDALLEETQRLASLYQQKLAALAALKKSLLHQAFTGEL